jgi:hypothetical protein
MHCILYMRQSALASCSFALLVVSSDDHFSISLLPYAGSLAVAPLIKWFGALPKGSESILPGGYASAFAWACVSVEVAVCIYGGGGNGPHLWCHSADLAERTTANKAN